LCWWAEPGADADRVGQSRKASQAVPERGAEDVGVERLWFVSLVRYGHSVYLYSQLDLGLRALVGGTYIDKRHVLKGSIGMLSKYAGVSREILRMSSSQLMNKWMFWERATCGVCSPPDLTQAPPRLKTALRMESIEPPGACDLRHRTYCSIRIGGVTHNADVVCTTSTHTKKNAVASRALGDLGTNSEVQ